MLRCPKCFSFDIKERSYQEGGYYGVQPWIYERRCLACGHEESLCSDSAMSGDSTFLIRNQKMPFEATTEKGNNMSDIYGDRTEAYEAVIRASGGKGKAADACLSLSSCLRCNVQMTRIEEHRADDTARVWHLCPKCSGGTPAEIFNKAKLMTTVPEKQEAQPLITDAQGKAIIEGLGQVNRNFEQLFRALEEMKAALRYSSQGLTPPLPGPFSRPYPTQTWLNPSGPIIGSDMLQGGSPAIKPEPPDRLGR